MPSITLLYGQWGTNIGNAFFNVGGTYILQTAFPNAKLSFISDVANHLLPWAQQGSKKVSHDAEIQSRLKTDYLVLQGPIFSPQINRIYGDVIAKLRAQGTRIILLSVGMNTYSPEEIAAGKRFLANTDPVFMVTRDTPTYEAFKQDVANIHCGIDSAFFCPRAYTPASMPAPFFCMACDQTAEPRLLSTAGHAQPSDRTVKLGANTYTLRQASKTQRWLRSHSRATKLLHSLWPQRLPSQMGDFAIIRPVHKTNPMIRSWVYRNPQTHASDEPYSYLTLYSNAALTITDRVHAAVATLAYGRPAIFLGATKRSALLDRVATKTDDTLTLNPTSLLEMQNAEIDFIRGQRVD
ncbi:MAG: polysaccharide pyruvyl transferase family protein [Planctomycetota bacterium]|jgi:polysaccharide pyruvyl transferase WcaK-like protein|nr:polysaccharide pyruvyl transferase family protein [Planctomycetota bacterium]